VHAYIVYQLLSRRIQRDLLLVSALLSSESGPQARGTNQKPNADADANPEQVDGRLFPAVVKLLDTVLQSLNQMRALSVVDDSPDLVSAVEARVSFTKARRCLFLARSYAPVKRYAEALSLIQHASIHVRETHSTLSFLSDPSPSPSSSAASFYPLPASSVSALESALATEGLALKRAWFAFNGGVADATPNKERKPLFFDIAVNYVALDMGALRARAGLQPVEESQVPAQPASAKVKAKEDDAAAGETASADSKAPGPAARSGLGSLLGGWWGRS
jgi:signal recognition particle subunit SRP68